MRIGRTHDHLVVVITADQYRELLPLQGFSSDGRLRCSGRLDHTGQHLVLTFGEGRVFTRQGNDSWRVQFDPDAAHSRSLERFSLTPTTHRILGRHRVAVQMPEARAPAFGRRAHTYAAPGRSVTLPPPKVTVRPVAVEPVEPVFAPDPPMPTLDEELMRACITNFNKAIERGFVPTFDGKGRIMWFDRRVS